VLFRSVSVTSATGMDSLYANVDFDNIYSSENTQFTSSIFHEWIISGESSIDIVSVSTTPEIVTQGQGSVNINVRIENNGDSDAQIDSLDLLFDNGISNYTIGVVSPALPLTIVQGADQLFTIQTTINGDAQTGPDTISTRLVVTDLISSSEAIVTDSRIIDAWMVQTTPQVVIDSVSINLASASTEQNGLIASVYVTNEDTLNTERATALIDVVDLVMTLGGGNQNAQFTITRKAIPILQTVLTKGAGVRYDFDVDVNPSALTGDYVISASVESQDLNNGQVTILNTTNFEGALSVQNAAALVMNSVTAVPDTDRKSVV